MKKLYAIGLIATAAVIIGLAWAEQLTFSTYYPAPAGVYNQMVTRCLGVGDQDGDGLNYADAPDPSISGQENDLWVAGSVGIGTTNPQTELEVRSTDGIAAIRLFENSLGESEGDFEIRAVQSPANDRLDFYTAYNSATLMSLEKDGNVGIGTTDPQEILDIDSTSSGILIPRMDDGQLTAIEPTVTEGSIAYNDDQDEVVYRDDTGWQSMGGGGWTTDGTIFNLNMNMNTWYQLDLSPIVGAREAFVLLRVKSSMGLNVHLVSAPYADRTNYDVGFPLASANRAYISASNRYALITTVTDNNGYVGLRPANTNAIWEITLVGYL